MTLSFAVTEDEIDRMLVHFTNHPDLKEEADFLSRLWIKEIMSKPNRKNKKRRRPFEYSKSKIRNYLQWRKDTRVTAMISVCLEDETRTQFSQEFESGCFYWFGIDKQGSPNLWFRMDRFPWESLDLKRHMDFSAVMIQGLLDVLPPHVTNVNVILLADKCPLMQLIKHPKIAPALMNLWLKSAPDRLKKCVMITGAVGGHFFKLVKKIAPCNVVDKINPVSSRIEAAKWMLEQGILKSEDDVPDFLGGIARHPEEIITSYPTMMKFQSIILK